MEAQHKYGLTRRRLMQLGALSVGGVIAAPATASASAAPPVPGQDGTPYDDPRLSTPLALTPATGAAVAKSYNGWPVGKTAAAIGVRSYLVPGTSIAIQVRSGDVATVLMHLAARFNTEVERLRAGQVGGYEYRFDANNAKWWSCHASGTAVDLNSVLHPNHASGTFAAPALARLRRLLADFDGVVFWGGDYSGVVDEMYYEINVPPGDPRLPALAARIRGVAPTPPVAVKPVHAIALRAGANGRYVAADIGGAHPLIASQTVVGGSEQFQVVTVDTGHVALRSRANNRFVCAEHAGTAPLIANRDQVGRWESFTMVRNSDGTVSLRSAVNGRYVTAEARGAQALIANRTTIGSWEKFAVTGF